MPRTEITSPCVQRGKIQWRSLFPVWIQLALTHRYHYLLLTYHYYHIPTRWRRMEARKPLAQQRPEPQAPFSMARPSDVHDQPAVAAWAQAVKAVMPTDDGSNPNGAYFELCSQSSSNAFLSYTMRYTRMKSNQNEIMSVLSCVDIRRFCVLLNYLSLRWRLFRKVRSSRRARRRYRSKATAGLRAQGHG